MGGTVWADSPGAGHGCTFHLALPLPASELRAAAPSRRSILGPRPRLAGKRVLYAGLGAVREWARGELCHAGLGKPLHHSAPYDTLADLLAGNESAPAPQDPAAAPAVDAGLAARHPLRILLAEDNLTNQKPALSLLSQRDYRADVAANGIEVIESLDRQRDDLALVDVQMPEMDGVEATRQIVARWPASQRPRIVAMTTNAMQGDREACLAAGMDDWATKPIRVDALARVLLLARPASRSGSACAASGSCRR